MSLPLWLLPLWLSICVCAAFWLNRWIGSFIVSNTGKGLDS